ncbi:hypothetical protein BRADI_4g10270v3 [Brachypodium distachyon]|uniref:F-box domain-containing protein n=2 Tax=Brachypodium distachyon TaxID=15368 RepID=I1IJF7_BRADI|nr:hypothetical protein BRADI_4g10270v3 [Brachypodium distachyon]
MAADGGGGSSRSGCGARDGARPVLVVSLPTHRNPRSAPVDTEPQRSTGAGRKESTGDAVLPEEIVVWEILVHLPAAAVLRCRAVCRSWRRLTSRADFILAHHRRQPSLPLVVLQGGTSTDPRPSSSEDGRRVLGLDEYYDGTGRRFKLCGSCDGLLLLSLLDRRFSICNPATRQCLPLPALTDAVGGSVVEALYLHGPSGEYRVLYWDEGTHLTDLNSVCYVMAVPQGREPRCIGIPAAFPGMELGGIARGRRMVTNNSRSPVQFRGCLYWDPGRSPHVNMVVFDTVAESFRSMRCPAAATSYCNRLHKMGGSLGFTCFEDCRTAAKIWVLEDREGEVWSLKYRIKFPVESMYNFGDTEHLVLSHKGDMLVQNYSGRCMFHCHSNGKLIQEFRWELWGSSITGHLLKESLVNHAFFPKRGAARVGQPHLFKWL